MGLLDQPTPASPSRVPSSHWSGPPTNIPCRRHWKNEEDPHLYTDETKPQKQKLERLRSTRLIRCDPKAMNSRHAKASSEIADPSLLAPTTKHF
jgi:hypothetical protein